jgi:imidazolonepropionase
MPTTPASCETLWTHAQLATMREDGNAYGMVNDGAVAINDGEICWLGPSADVPDWVSESAREIVDCRGQLVTPGLIDCHTHLVYGGDRVNEFEQRLKGASYEEIARAGGGIKATVNATREGTAESLYAAARSRLHSLMEEGVTTIEIKSGYGLNTDTEIKMLEVARELGDKNPVDIVTTFLGAHATPPEYAGREDEYIDYLCDETLPLIASLGLADQVDAFCERIAFSTQQVTKIFSVAQRLGLPLKLHAEQLSDSKGALRAANMGALSVDHLEYLAPEDVPVLKAHGTAAVLLPGAFYFLRETKLPPIDALREAGVPMAIASDSNPGSSPVGSLLLMLSMASRYFQLTPEECLAGVTLNAAKALGLDTQAGSLEVGKLANLVLWNITNPAELSYGIGYNPCRKVMYRGSVR